VKKCYECRYYVPTPYDGICTRLFSSGVHDPTYAEICEFYEDEE